MPIQSIKVRNVMAFQNSWRKNNADTKDGVIQNSDVLHDHFELQFSDGINVIIGENGMGKTTLLKMIYAATQTSIQRTNTGKTDQIYKYFSSDIKDGDLLKNHKNKEGYCGFEVSVGEHTFDYSFSHKGMFNFEDWVGLNLQSVFIPTTEMLSHSKGFLALNEKFKMPFDGTQVDIIVNASLPEARVIPDYMNRILHQLSDVMGGEVLYENDAFYMVKSDGEKVDFSLEAEGLRKLGLLWKLIRNGLLESGTILLWDEPEANINPELFSLVAKILLELQKNGIQIFLATHSYNFAKYLEILRTEEKQVQFHSLCKGTSELPDVLRQTYPDKEYCEDIIYGTSAFTLEKLQPNSLMDADEELLDFVFSDKAGRI